MVPVGRGPDGVGSVDRDECGACIPPETAPHLLSNPTLTGSSGPDETRIYSAAFRSAVRQAPRVDIDSVSEPRCYRSNGEAAELNSMA